MAWQRSPVRARLAPFHEITGSGARSRRLSEQAVRFVDEQASAELFEDRACFFERPYGVFDSFACESASGKAKERVRVLDDTAVLLEAFPRFFVERPGRVVLAAGFGEDRQRAGDKPMERRFEAVRVAEQSLQGLQIPGGGAHTPDRRQISEHLSLIHI